MTHRDPAWHLPGRFARLLFPLLAVALVAAACGEKTSSSQSGSGAPRDTLRVASGAPLDNWETVDKPNVAYLSTVFEGLVENAPDGITQEPRLATEWKQTDKELSFTLRSGVTFHDGTPFNAEAVKVNLERIRTQPNQFQSMLDPVEEIVVTDDTHLTLKLSRSAPTLVPQLARRGGLILSPKSIADKSYVRQPAGTGPWTFNSRDSVQGSKVVLDRYDKYYAPEEIGPKRMEIIFVADDEARANGLKTGELDIVAQSPNKKQIIESQGFKTMWFVANRYHFLFFDRKKTFADPRVRMAICHAMDRDAIIQGQWGGLGQTYTMRFSEGEPGFDPSVAGYKHDVAEAKRLLAEAGNPKVSFTYPHYASHQPLVDLLKAQLAEAGIELKPEKLSTSEYFSTFDTGKYPAALNSSISEETGFYDYYQYRFAANGAGNPLKIASPALDELARRGLAAADAKAQEPIWQQMGKYINDQALDCGFMSNVTMWVWNPKRVENVEATRYEPGSFRYKDTRLVS